MSGLLEQQLQAENGEAVETARKDGLPALQILRKYAKAESVHVRRLVLQCYAQVGGDEAITALADGLEDPDINVRTTAVRMLHRVNGPAVVPKLLSAMAKSSDEFVRGQSALILGRIGLRASAAAVRNQMQQELDPKVGQQMNLALARLGDVEARRRVLVILLDPNQRARYEAIGDVEYVNDPALASRLEPLLEDVRPVRNLGTEPYPVWHRVCDRAVEAVAALLPGRLSFETGGRSYTDREIGEARELIASIPQAGER